MGRNDKKSKDPKKCGKYLEHGTVILNTVNQKVNIHNTIYAWRVPKYPKLKLNVMYFQAFDGSDVKCVFKLFKTNSTLYLCLWSGQLVKKEAQFYVISETQHTNLSVQAREIRDGLYAGEFQYEMFDDPRLPYLQDDMLTVSFRYVSARFRDYNEIAFDGVDVLSDLDELCCDLKHMYLESMYPDFEIKVKDYVFKAHKFVLSARSPFFQNYFDGDSDAMNFTVDSLPGILHEVLLYVYCGELKDMDLPCMMKVFDLANVLNITSLIDKCVEYFVKYIDGKNVNEFHSFQQVNENPELNEVLEKVRAHLCSK